jgi:separase
MSNFAQDLYKAFCQPVLEHISLAKHSNFNAGLYRNLLIYTDELFQQCIMKSLGNFLNDELVECWKRISLSSRHKESYNLSLLLTSRLRFIDPKLCFMIMSDSIPGLNKHCEISDIEGSYRKLSELYNNNVSIILISKVLGEESCIWLCVHNFQKNLFLIVKIELLSPDGKFMASAFSEFLADMDKSTHSGSSAKSPSQKAQWCKTRKKLDERLHRLITQFEDSIGIWKVIFCPVDLPSEVFDEVFPKLEKVLFDSKLGEFRDLLCASIPVLCSCSGDDLSFFLDQVLYQFPNDPRKLSKIRKSLERIAKEYRSVQVETSSTSALLILEDQLQMVPWESFSYCTDLELTRIPSAYVLCELLKKQEANSQLPHSGIDPSKSFYVLNPSGDLVQTQERFLPLFEKLGWEGVCSECPSSSEMGRALETSDLLVYCGHNGGQQYVRPENYNVRALPILLGCSSARTRYDVWSCGRGLSLSYLCAGSPGLLGNLWDVTDADIDRVGVGLLEEWLKGGVGLSEALNKCRGIAKYRWLTGSAAVCYGIRLPAVLNK